MCLNIAKRDRHISAHLPIDQIARHSLTLVPRSLALSIANSTDNYSIAATVAAANDRNYGAAGGIILSHASLPEIRHATPYAE